MKIKVSETTPIQLDWLVAKCLGGVVKPSRCFDCKHYEERQGRDEAIQYCHHPKMDFEDGSGAIHSWPSDHETHSQCPISDLTPEPFSTDPAQGQPILEREGVHTGPLTYGNACRVIGKWRGIIGYAPDGGEHLFEQFGPTMLIAGLRCFVASKLGDEVEVPDDRT
ncbi:phage protein NinX family protein [Rhodoferax fermentans]|uniref:DUF2591 domain-containing protein n=1 Tax=Rhodoferax fermentans TaxID=28066 RepID=A0A1T1ANT7_RHOFE|nr:phage protein NinX family protein [Rhodoferax fermentans]OOV05786.1 hypothetical protein RF819_02840 [Rhodoferax fermentans]